jgi:hypothetical protein
VGALWARRTLVPVPRLAPLLLWRCARGDSLPYTTNAPDQGADDPEITFLTLMPEDNQGLDMETSSKSNGFNEYRAIWSRGLIMSTLLLLFVYTAGNFSYYGMVVLTSELNNSSRSCASVGAHLKKTKDFHLYINVLVTNFAGRLCSGQI